nr:hypothetical protein ['Planchonia careya' phytoplasma]
MEIFPRFRNRHHFSASVLDRYFYLALINGVLPVIPNPESQIKPLKTEEVFAFLQFYALNNNFLLSLPTLNLLPQLN